MAKATNPTQVTTGVVRLSYANVYKPVVANDGGEPKYSACLIISKDDEKTISKIKAAIEAAKEAGKSKLADSKGKIPSTIKLPLRDGDEERSDDSAFENSLFLNASSLRQPIIVDRHVQRLIEEDAVYSGCYCCVSLNFFAFNTNGNKGIAVGLNNIQKVRDGERLAGASNPEDDFEEFDDDLL